MTKITLEKELKSMCQDCFQAPCICDKFDAAIATLKSYKPPAQDSGETVQSAWEKQQQNSGSGGTTSR